MKLYIQGRKSSVLYSYLPYKITVYVFILTDQDYFANFLSVELRLGQQMWLNFEYIWQPTNDLPDL